MLSVDMSKSFVFLFLWKAVNEQNFVNEHLTGETITILFRCFFAILDLVEFVASYLYKLDQPSHTHVL